MSAPYQVIRNEQTLMVRHPITGRTLGGVGHSYFRPWVFPLYTPSGLTVLEAFPHEHPWHNGIFVGQNPVVFEHREVNFWGIPLERHPNDDLAHSTGRMAVQGEPRFQPLGDGADFVFDCLWLDEQKRPVLRESRSIRWYAMENATICDVISQKYADYGDILFPQTKFGAIGIRVEPRLLPALGGLILADRNRCGNAAIVHEGDSDYVAYECHTPGGARFGVMLHILDDVARGPWFIRDYGMAMYNPTWRRAISIARGQSLATALRVIAYDGVFDQAALKCWTQVNRGGNGPSA